METNKFLAWQDIVLTIIITITSYCFFLLIYGLVFQFDGNSSCHPLFSCITVGWISKYSELVVLPIAIIFKFIFKDKNLPLITLAVNLLVFISIILVISLGNMPFAKNLEYSKSFCSIIKDDQKRNSCFYRIADRDKNLSECDLMSNGNYSGNNRYACRAKINFDICNSIQNQSERKTCFDNIPK